MSDIYEVASWFISNSPEINNKKLQKLVYYSYAWYLTLNNESAEMIENRFFNARFEAWIHGAVEPNLYEKYRKYGSRVIPNESKEDFNFSPEELDILEQVNSVYGNFNGNELESICHQESPWRIARGNLPSNVPSHNLISDRDIFNCYAARLQNE